MGIIKVDKDDIKNLYDRIGALETNDKVKDEKIDTLLTMSKDTLSSIQEHTKVFKRHDEKEMEKYDQNDKHIMELTTTVKTVVSSISEMNNRITNQDEVIVTNKKETDETLKEVLKKQNQFIGGIAVIVIVIGMLGLVINYVESEKDKAEKAISRELKTNEELEKKLQKLELYVNRNHAILDKIKPNP